jgi:hypothetical protein
MGAADGLVSVPASRPGHDRGMVRDQNTSNPLAHESPRGRPRDRDFVT